jgi:hypothetical protein
VGLSDGTEVCNDTGPMHCAGSLVDLLSSQPCLEVYAAEQSQFFVAVQVKSAMRLLRWDKMVRARQQRRYKHFSTQATRALLRVSSSTRPHMTGDTHATRNTHHSNRVDALRSCILRCTCSVWWTATSNMRSSSQQQSSRGCTVPYCTCVAGWSPGWHGHQLCSGGVEGGR